MHARFPAVLAAVFGACFSSPTAPPEPSALRLSSTAGLEAISPHVSATITRNLLDLVYEYGDRFIDRVESDGERWRLVLRKDLRHPPKTLAATLWHERLIKAEAEGDSIAVTLSPGEPPEPRDFLFDVGPYTQDSFTPDKLILKRRRGGEGLQRIEVVRVDSQEEEWRRFLAREVDLSVDMSPGTLTYVQDVPSVRVVALEKSPRVALHFRLTSPIFKDREMRRKVAAAVRRDAIAVVATGDRAAALPAELPPAAMEAAGQPVRLVFLPSAWDHRQAAIVLEQQLIEMGFEVTLIPVTVEQMISTLDTGDFDAWLFYTAFNETRAEKYTTGNPDNIWGYSNPEYDQAVAAGKFDIAEAILKHDVPYTPLYRIPEAVAVDRRFCGVHPKVNYDLSWLADVHVCAPGEAQ